MNNTTEQLTAIANLNIFTYVNQEKMIVKKESIVADIVEISNAKVYIDAYVKCKVLRIRNGSLFCRGLVCSETVVTENAELVTGKDSAICEKLHTKDKLSIISYEQNNEVESEFDIEYNPDQTIVTEITNIKHTKELSTELNRYEQEFYARMCEKKYGFTLPNQNKSN